MRAAGLSHVRLAEFAWARLEPAENQFEWAWLDSAIEVLASEGLKVILGTPTAAPPAWLVRAAPEILPVDEDGHRREFGSRRHYCPTQPAFREHAGRIVAAMARRYGPHPAVVGWQIDNELGDHDTGRCYCEACVSAFRQWLARNYRTLAALNEAWGTEFWSQGYTDWSQIDAPNRTVAGPNPSHVLDYYRFSSDSYASYLQLQLDLLRQWAAGQAATTNFILSPDPGLDYHQLSRPLNFVSWDSYPTGYAEVQAKALYGPDSLRPRLAFDLGDPYVTGFAHDLARGLKASQPFWILEQQCGHINWGVYNPGVRAGAVRLWTWHAVAAGAEAVFYFNWRATLFAQEQYHSGLLNHDASPAVGYADLLAMQPERDLMARVAAEPVQAHAALLLDYADLWALQLQPHRHDFGYLRHLFVFYRALRRFGLTVDLVTSAADLSRYPLVIAPTLFLASEPLAQSLASYVEAGGHLLCGVRSGFKTPSNRVTDQPLPGPLRSLLGATIMQWHALPPGVDYALASSVPGLDGAASLWAEALTPLPAAAGQPAATVLAEYAGGPFAGQAALVETQQGLGQASYLGWYPTECQAAALARHLASRAGVSLPADLPPGLILAQRGRYSIFLNFTDEPLTSSFASRTLTVAARNVIVLSDD